MNKYIYFIIFLLQFVTVLSSQNNTIKNNLEDDYIQKNYYVFLYLILNHGINLF